MTNLRLFLASFVFLLCGAVNAQKPNLLFHQLSVNDGLSENTLRGILEDKKGFMWFGTEDGLNRYDGYEFNIYKKDPSDIYSLSNSGIKLFFTDSKDHFWILTRNGLNLYDPALNRFYNYRNDKYPALKLLTGDLDAMAEDKVGNLWMVGEDGLFKISSLMEEPEHFEHVSDENDKLLISVLPDSDSTLWIGTRDGLLKFHTITKKYSNLRHKYGKGYEIKTMYKDGNGNLWLCTTSGLKKISPDGSMKEYLNKPNDPFSINGNNVAEVISYNDGNFLIGIDGGGLDYFEVATERFYHFKDQLSSNNVTSIYIDSKGDLWVGTYLNGVNFSNATTNLFVLIRNNPYSDFSVKNGIVTRFLKDSRGDFWIATDGGGLYRKNKDSEKYIQYKAQESGLSSNAVISLIEDEKGFIWMTTYGGGLCRLNPANNSWKVYRHNPEDPYSLSNDKIKDIILYKDKLWITGYQTGISVLDRKSGKFFHEKYDKTNPSSIRTDWVQCFMQDREGRLWVSSLRGISLYDHEKGSFKNYSFENLKDNSTDINFIVDMLEDKNGNFWLASSGSGLLLFNKEDGSCEVFNTSHGLSDNSLKGMIEDDEGILWISTNNGITSFDPETRRAKAYTVKEGLPPCSFYFNARYKDEKGRIFFGANNGYLMIDHLNTKVNRRVPPVVITEFRIFNQKITNNVPDSPLEKDISETTHITLSHNQNSLTFEFTALNFNNPGNNQYAYTLEGFDNTWYYTGSSQRSATYTNINPGTYIFRVKGSNNDNVWNEAGASIVITITPPFWKTWWFTLLAVVTIIMCLYLLYTWRIKSIRNKNMLLEETILQRTRELQESNEQLEGFVYKASHDIKGPLRSIIGLTTIGQKDVKDVMALQYFDHILKSTTKLDNLLKDLLEVTKVKQLTITPEKINFYNLINDALASFENFPGYNKMKISVSVEAKKAFYSDKKLLTSIIQNLIENPIKYADHLKEERLLDIRVFVSDKGADLIFKDNGLGIPKEMQTKIFDMFFKIDERSQGTGLGLYIVKTAVEKLQGTIRLESEQGQGTSVYVKI